MPLSLSGLAMSEAGEREAGALVAGEGGRAGSCFVGLVLLFGNEMCCLEAEGDSGGSFQLWFRTGTCV